MITVENAETAVVEATAEASADLKPEDFVFEDLSTADKRQNKDSAQDVTKVQNKSAAAVPSEAAAQIVTEDVAEPRTR